MMSREKRTKSTGGAKPRTHLLPMMALVLVGFLALAGVVAADGVYGGAAPVTVADGTVSGGAWVDWNDGWNTTPVTDWSQQTNISVFTGIPATGSNVKLAKLYVVPYLGSMTADYTGCLTVDWTGADDVTTVLTGATPYPLDLSYNPGSGPTYDYPGLPYFEELNRVTSDYVAIFNVTTLVNASTITVNVHTTNDTWVSGNKFDGRIKEVKLVVIYNDGDNDVINYWINEGHDPVTKYDSSYIGSTTFSGVPAAGEEEPLAVKMWVDYLASNNGEGTYTWNTNPVTGWSKEQGVYSGLLQKAWNSDENPGLNVGNNVLTYDNTTSYYKMIVGVLTVQ